jgi:hypothetical protein
MAISIDVHERVNFTPEEVKKHQQACTDAVKVLNSKRFKERFLKEKLTSVEGLTNLQVYEKLMSGVDLFNKTADRDIDVFVEMYYQNNRVVGYTTPNINKTYLNRKFFSDYDAADVACNMVHEYLHKVGFDHVSAKESTSVPYAIGYLVEKCIREMWLNPGLYEESVDGVESPKPEPKPTPVEAKPETVPEVPKQLYCKRLWYTLWTKKVCWYE